MKQVVYASIVGLGIQCFLIYGYIFCVRNIPWNCCKTTFLILVPLLAFAYNVIIARNKSTYAILAINAVVSVGVVVFIQIIGFTWYPGLVKDLQLLSFEHLVNFMKTLVFATVMYETIAVFGKWMTATILNRLRLKRAE